MNRLNLSKAESLNSINKLMPTRVTDDVNETNFDNNSTNKPNQWIGIGIHNNHYN